MSANPDHLWPEMTPPGSRGFPADDMALLLRYVESTSQAAFAELVSRHHRLVHSTCRQQLHDSHLADDATQTVFMTLARKASTLPADVRLRGWLYHTARHVASDLRKQEKRRRRRHDQVVQTALERGVAAEAPDENLRLTIAEIIGNLPARDRRAISMRYFEGMTFVEMAQTLGLSREGAKKRVIRALARIRAKLDARKWHLAIFMPIGAMLHRTSAAKAMASEMIGSSRVVKILGKGLRALVASATSLSRLTAVRLATSSAVVAVAVFSAQKLPPVQSTSMTPGFRFYSLSIPQFEAANTIAPSNSYAFSPELPHVYSSYPRSSRTHANSVVPSIAPGSLAPSPIFHSSLGTASAVAVAGAHVNRLDLPAIAIAKRMPHSGGVAFSSSSNVSASVSTPAAPTVPATPNPPADNSGPQPTDNHQYPNGFSVALGSMPGDFFMFGSPFFHHNHDSYYGGDGPHGKGRTDFDGNGFPGKPVIFNVPPGLRGFAISGPALAYASTVNFGPGFNPSDPPTYHGPVGLSSNIQAFVSGMSGGNAMQVAGIVDDPTKPQTDAEYAKPVVINNVVSTSQIQINSNPEQSVSGSAGGYSALIVDPATVDQTTEKQPVVADATAVPKVPVSPDPPHDSGNVSEAATVDSAPAPTFAMPLMADAQTADLSPIDFASVPSAPDSMMMFSMAAPSMSFDSFSNFDSSAGADILPEFSFVQAVPEPAGSVCFVVISGLLLLRRPINGPEKTEPRRSPDCI